ncbi:MAG: hypothetical protein HYY13_08500 [Nitrospirae bacterium]|nr:hypothetical protein [Nitrospirota bacterium]
MNLARPILGVCALWLLEVSACEDNSHIDTEIAIDPTSHEALARLLNKAWFFSVPPASTAKAPSRQASIACGGSGKDHADVRLQDGTVIAFRITNQQGLCALAREKGDLSPCPDKGDPLKLWAGLVTDERPFANPTKISDDAPWSLTAALTPGGHHVRLYLQNKGETDTIISKKDNFTDFYDSDVGNIEFTSADGSRPSDLSPSAPNVARNDLGVYAMTWDNRALKVTRDTALGLSTTFGLAFSVDGLNWIVHSNDLRIEGTFPKSCGKRYEGSPSEGECCIGLSSSEFINVAPIFITDDQISISFSAKYANTGICIAGGPQGCSGATAISN